jgi:hypothetical protein
MSPSAFRYFVRDYIVLSVAYRVEPQSAEQFKAFIQDILDATDLDLCLLNSWKRLLWGKASHTWAF